MAINKVALVVGNTTYKNYKNLKNPKNDAKDIIKSLTDIGFKVTYGYNLTKNDFNKLINKFNHQLEKGDVALFYYAGHGFQVAGDNYIVPINAKPYSLKNIKKQHIKVDSIINLIMDKNVHLGIILLDACRDDPDKSRNIKEEITFRSNGFAQPKISQQGLLIGYATNPGNVASDGAGRNSPYVLALKEYIKTPNISISEMLNKVGLKVSQQTQQKQQPWVSSSPIPRFCFVDMGSCNNTFNKFPEMVFVKGGCYQMGSPENETERDSDENQHEVCVDDFYMGRYEINFFQYDQYVKETFKKFPDDEGWGRNDKPVININWNEAVAYTKWLNDKTGLDYRLPTEVEWEYAARAGHSEMYIKGNSIECSHANYGYEANYCNTNKTTWSNSYYPNDFGLYNMYGNVAEWTCSAYSSSYDGNERVCKNNLVLRRAFRGGSWFDRPKFLRAAKRRWMLSFLSFNHIGFRVVYSIPKKLNQ